MRNKLLVVISWSLMVASLILLAGASWPLSRKRGAAINPPEPGMGESKNAGQTSQAPPLSDEQKRAIKKRLDEIKKRAEPLALRLAQTAKKVYENMLADQPDEALRRKLSNEMKELTGELVLLKGQSIREVVNLLTPEQKRLVRA